MNIKFYYFIRSIVNFLFRFLFRPEYIGTDRIPNDGRVILAGNHISYLDCCFILTSTKRIVRVMAMKELLEWKIAFIFKRMGMIFVDRKKKNPEGQKEAINILNNEECLGIFPEGGINFTEYLLKPFKMGAVSIAKKTGSPIIPFIITGPFKLFRRSARIVFLEPIYITGEDLVIENNTLMNTIIKELEYSYE